MNKNRLEAFSDSFGFCIAISGLLYITVALIWIIPDSRIEKQIN